MARWSKKKTNIKYQDLEKSKYWRKYNQTIEYCESEIFEP
jgi:hypothetical protein